MTSTIQIQAFDDSQREWEERFMTEAWGTPLMVTRGKLYNVLDYPGFVGLIDGQPQGLATYRIDDAECELMVLNSAVEGAGIGTELVGRVKQAAIDAGCKRLWLITTNDNIHAIRWYQRRGFVIAAVYVNALAESRKLKPEIPLIGDNDIPLRDEIEFEMTLD
jgi:GNAT superfamily N-acetyltransferase